MNIKTRSCNAVDNCNLDMKIVLKNLN